MKAQLPKISCLTVTINRIVLLKQAIDCFLKQSYSNKELVIVTDGSQREKKGIAQYIDSLNTKDIKLVALEENGLTLGKLRNISLERSTGEIICQWDDDDLYHSDRLKLQYQNMMSAKAKACFLADQLHYFNHSNELFWVDWVASNSIPERDQLFPGSVMMFKDSRFIYPEEGDNSETGEDSDFMYQLYKKIEVVKLRHHGYLYVYRYHGRNVFDIDHHSLIAKMHSCTKDFAQSKEGLLRRELDEYLLPRPFTFKVRNDEPFFCQS